ncbi:MAG: hypothetical protein ACI94Z_000876, partial [Yoonia sp.]
YQQIFVLKDLAVSSNTESSIRGNIVYLYVFSISNTHRFIE